MFAEFIEVVTTREELDELANRDSRRSAGSAIAVSCWACCSPPPAPSIGIRGIGSRGGLLSGSRRQGTGRRCPAPWTLRKHKGHPGNVNDHPIGRRLTFFDHSHSSSARNMHEYTTLFVPSVAADISSAGPVGWRDLPEVCAQTVESKPDATVASAE